MELHFNYLALSVSSLLVQVKKNICRDAICTFKLCCDAVRFLVRRGRNRNLVRRRKAPTFKRRVIVALLVHRFIKALSPTKPPPKLGTFACHLPTSQIYPYCQQKFSLLFFLLWNSTVVTIWSSCSSRYGPFPTSSLKSTMSREIMREVVLCRFHSQSQDKNLI